MNIALVSISIDRSRLPTHTDDQFEEWVKYCVGQCSGISLDNPMYDLDMTATVEEFG